MTLQRFQAIVLKLGNQMFVRHYLWLNYPLDPQLMGVEFFGGRPGTKRATSCDCGACDKCMHRKYMRNWRPSGRLSLELLDAGFQFDDKLKMWTVERTES